jgi:DinB family protein
MRRGGLIASAFLLLGVSALAQAPMASQTITIAVSVQRAYAAVKGNLTQAADKMPEADYGFKPSTMAEVRTFGQLFAHVANAQFGSCAAAKGVPNPNQGRNLENELKTKAEFVKALADSFAFCDDAYAALTDANANEPVTQGRGMIARAALLANNVTHDNEMYGTSGVYLRAKNIVPPSTENATMGRGAPPAGRGRGGQQ